MQKSFLKKIKYETKAITATRTLPLGDFFWISPLRKLYLGPYNN